VADVDFEFPTDCCDWTHVDNMDHSIDNRQGSIPQSQNQASP